ncbi:MAG: hypothetical protein J6P61_06320 [Erysipelotrichaceae bacterium]|nr:hypothetical protein [Erysipelotrichaceae bacterium]
MIKQVEVNKDEETNTYEIDLSQIDVSIPEAISLLRKLKRSGKVTIKEIKKEGKVFWKLED